MSAAKASTSSSHSLTRGIHTNIDLHTHTHTHTTVKTVNNNNLCCKNCVKMHFQMRQISHPGKLSTSHTCWDGLRTRVEWERDEAAGDTRGEEKERLLDLLSGLTPSEKKV